MRAHTTAATTNKLPSTTSTSIPQLAPPGRGGDARDRPTVPARCWGPIRLLREVRQVRSRLELPLTTTAWVRERNGYHHAAIVDEERHSVD